MAITIETILRNKQRSEDMMRSVHDEARDNHAFYHGDQWGDKENKRKDMGRTSHVFNILPSYVLPVVNAVKQAPPSIRIQPLGMGAKQEWASLTASRIRMLGQQCQANRAYLHALEDACIGGIGVFRTIPKKIRMPVVREPAATPLRPARASRRPSQ